MSKPVKSCRIAKLAKPLVRIPRAPPPAADVTLSMATKGNEKGEERGKKLGKGMTGTVFFPPLKCGDSKIETDVQKIGKRLPLVMKHTELALALTAVNTAELIRHRWATLQKQSDSQLLPAMKMLLKEVASHKPDDYFVLTLPQVCARCISPEDGTALDQDGALVGIYMPHGGRVWKSAMPEGRTPLTRIEMNIVRHLICGLLLLHAMGITHNDVRKYNVTVDSQNIPRFIDWELCSRPDESSSNHKTQKEEQEEEEELYVDTVPDDRRWFTNFAVGFFSNKSDLIARDWQRLGNLFLYTFDLSGHALKRKYPENTKLLLQVINLLNQRSDKQALLALILLENV